MIITNGFVVDPKTGTEGVRDIHIEDGKVRADGTALKGKPDEVFDAKGRIVIPGAVDLHVHLREPGREDVETVSSGTRAAVAGGITSVCAMPNTQPAIDSAERVRNLQAIIAKDACVNVCVVGAITVGRAGAELVDMPAMKRAGVVALSDDGNAIQDPSLMREALRRAKENDLLIIAHCENTALSGKGVVNEGIVATKLGLRGIPRKAEYEFVQRDLRLAKEEGARIHIAHVSCRESVDIIRRAKGDGVAVTAETAPHYFSLQDICCETYDTRMKMNPPLRSADDVAAVIEGLADGTIDAIASDHAPHSKDDKEIEFEFAAFGIIGLETLIGLSILNLVHTKKISWMRFAKLVSANPARIAGLQTKGSLSEGSDADITIIDPEISWVYAKTAIRSKSKNSPFIDWEFKGRPCDVFIGGKRQTA